jgi:hypothetical protein
VIGAAVKVMRIATGEEPDEIVVKSAALVPGGAVNMPRNSKCPMTNAPCTNPKCARGMCVSQQRAEFQTQQLEERRAVGRKLNEFLKSGSRRISN